MNKEDRNQFLIPLPNWLAKFISHLHISPQGLLEKRIKMIVWYGMDLSFQTGKLFVLI